MGMSRGWRSALAGTAAAVVVLALLVALAGVALRDYVNAAFLQFIVGALLLVFGLQWLRIAMLRSAGLKALHDEDLIFADEVAAARAAGSGPNSSGSTPSVSSSPSRACCWKASRSSSSSSPSGLGRVRTAEQ